jgi:hypothetical protein
MYGVAVVEVEVFPCEEAPTFPWPLTATAVDRGDGLALA